MVGSPPRARTVARTVQESSRVEQQARVVAAEAEAVAHGHVDFALAGLVGRVVEIAVGIGRLVVDRRRDHAVVRCARTSDTSSTPPLAPSRWPSWLLVLEIAQLAGRGRRRPLDRRGLGLVAQRRAGAVGVDVVDLGRDRARRRPGPASSPGRRRRRSSSGWVMWPRVAAGAVAEHLGVDPGAAGLGVLELFEHQHAGSFGRARSRRGRRRRAAGRLAGSSLRSDRARMLRKPARPSGVTAASVPPVTITSASPYWIARRASPMALAALAQAVATA